MEPENSPPRPLTPEEMAAQVATTQRPLTPEEMAARVAQPSPFAAMRANLPKNNTFRAESTATPGASSAPRRPSRQAPEMSNKEWATKTAKALPGAVARAAVGAFNNISDTAVELGGALGGAVGLPEMIGGETKQAYDTMFRSGYRVSDLNPIRIPEQSLDKVFGAPSSLAIPEMVETMGRFIGEQYVGGAALKGLKGVAGLKRFAEVITKTPVAKGLSGGFVAASVEDPNNPLVTAQLIKALSSDPNSPAAKAIDEFIKADSESPALIKRLTRGLEDMGLGLVLEGAVVMLRGYRAGARAVEQGKTGRALFDAITEGAKPPAPTTPLFTPIQKEDGKVTLKPIPKEDAKAAPAPRVNQEAVKDPVESAVRDEAQKIAQEVGDFQNAASAGRGVKEIQRMARRRILKQPTEDAVMRAVGHAERYRMGGNAMDLENTVEELGVNYAYTGNFRELEAHLVGMIQTLEQKAGGGRMSLTDEQVKAIAARNQMSPEVAVAAARQLRISVDNLDIYLTGIRKSANVAAMEFKDVAERLVIDPENPALMKSAQELMDAATELHFQDQALRTGIGRGLRSIQIDPTEVPNLMDQLISGRNIEEAERALGLNVRTIRVAEQARRELTGSLLERGPEAAGKVTKAAKAYRAAQKELAGEGSKRTRRQAVLDALGDSADVQDALKQGSRDDGVWSRLSRVQRVVKRLGQEGADEIDIAAERKATQSYLKQRKDLEEEIARVAATSCNLPQR